MTAALWGTLLLVGKQPLLSESLSHACYPGLLLGALVGCKCSVFSNTLFPTIILGVIASISGYKAIIFLERKFGVHRDSALCFILVSFFACGVLLASYVKDCCPTLYNRINAYLYGQAATLGYSEAKVAAGVFLISIFVLWLFYRQLVVSIFDREFASTCGLRMCFAENILLIFTSLVIVGGVRSVGIILIAAMFVAPALAARQMSNRLGTILLLASLFGGLSGALGCYISVTLSCQVMTAEHISTISLPTGPLVVVISGMFTFLCLLFSPKSGWVVRWIRRRYFSFTKKQEHLLKVFWYLLEEHITAVKEHTFVQSYKYHEYFGSKSFPRLRIFFLQLRGLLKRTECYWSLTEKGRNEAKRLVRAHRLWESYLVESLDFKKGNVHQFAEEIEHVFTDELEEAIVARLQDPDYDPHNRLIPKRKHHQEE
ncbi:fecCD transport family protein [Chlamydia ibidis]|uniref:FecCD transport family protein n=3 Tax=Chlamydia ibidis TaxID=1405396 RepID=S7J5M1_9CHLA|nr:fecCD transport family protein [Chlamydia ibidis]EQM62681.1 fecCD transport family protein [Chlamydia ibidis 10-1398/6]